MRWYHIFASLAVAATAASAQQELPAAAAETETIEAQKDRYERLTVPVTIMGEGPFRFMVDTGSQATVLAIGLAESLELNQRSPAVLVGMASRADVETTEIPEFAIGRRTISIATAPLVERANIGGADGILGLDSLQDQRVLIDFVNREISLADANEVSRSKGYEIVVKARRKLGQLIIANARIDGIRTAVIVDTGAQGSVGNPYLQQRLRRAYKREDTTIIDVNGAQITGAMRVARRIELGDMELHNIPIAFADSPTFHHLGLTDEPAMVLGMSELRLFERVAIDFSKARVLFDMPKGTYLQNLFRLGGMASRLDT